MSQNGTMFHRVQLWMWNPHAATWTRPLCEVWAFPIPNVSTWALKISINPTATQQLWTYPWMAARLINPLRSRRERPLDRTVHPFVRRSRPTILFTLPSLAGENLTAPLRLAMLSLSVTTLEELVPILFKL